MSSAGAAGGATGAAGAAAAAQAATTQAIKASGAIVRVEPDTLNDLLQRAAEAPLVVHAEWKFLGFHHHLYLAPYRGLIFLAKSPSALEHPEDAELIEAEKFWVPN